MMSLRTGVIAALVTGALLAPSMQAQGTLSGLGFGYPVGGTSTRAAATGGAFGEFDISQVAAAPVLVARASYAQRDAGNRRHGGEERGERGDGVGHGIAHIPPCSAGQGLSLIHI